MTPRAPEDRKYLSFAHILYAKHIVGIEFLYFRIILIAVSIWETYESSPILVHFLPNLLQLSTMLLSLFLYLQF